MAFADSQGTLSHVDAAAKGHWGYSLLVWLAVVLYVAPLLVAWNLWDTLDHLPYLLCLGAGCVVSWSLWRVLRRRASPASLGWLPMSAIAWAPCLAVAAGLGANQLLDASPPVSHEAAFLGYQHAPKGPDRVRFTSWREAGAEERLTCSMWRRAELCLRLSPGDKVVIATHRGALGWEWVDSIARR